MIKKHCDNCKKITRDDNCIEVSRISVGGSGVWMDMHFCNVDCLKKYIDKKYGHKNKTT